SPDGTCLLVPSEDFRIRTYELPRELYSGKIPPDFMESNFTPALTVKEGGLVYDTCWYPFMNSWQPASCCFLSTSKESPAYLWDAFTGELRATYRPYNQMDEIEATISVQFVDSCGFKNAVRIFDTSYSGRQTSTIEFRHDFPNMIGLVSCIPENPIMPGLVAMGTYSKCIGGTDGNITVWELPDVTEHGENLNPKYKIKLSEDCINGTSLHKTLPIVATSSGQRGIETEHRDNSVKLWRAL
ncbi:Telomerase Cajal body protein, partial [Ooceraea biroi]